MFRPRAASAAALAAVTTAAIAVAAAAPASAAVLASESSRCGSALVTATLERAGQQHEIDVEVYAGPRERWTLTVRDLQGRELERIVRTTNREGEFDAWRYLASRPHAVDVMAQGPGIRCSLELRA